MTVKEIPSAVLPKPPNKRLNGCGTLCVGEELTKAISTYNTGRLTEEQLPEIDCTPRAFSLRLQKAAVECFSRTKLGKYLGKKKFQEIQSSVPAHVFHGEMQKAKDALSTRFRIVLAIENLWAAHNALMNKLRTAKRDSRKKNNKKR